MSEKSTDAHGGAGVSLAVFRRVEAPPTRRRDAGATNLPRDSHIGSDERFRMGRNRDAH
jgi:hypothetical protein